jgi:PhoPQ-activated pathogenicity-related protein
MVKKLLVLLGICLSTESIARADLASYISRDEKCFAWSVKNKTVTPLGSVYEIDLTSQCWQGINWEHQILVCIPAGMKPRKTMLLWNTGGKASTSSALFGMQRCFLAFPSNRFLMAKRKMP